MDVSSFNIALPENFNETIKDKNSSKLYSFIKDVLKPVNPTILEGHKNPNTNSSFVYDNKTDTAYICTFLDFLKGSYVKNKEDLNNAFKNISVSKNDTIDFIA